MASTAHLCIGNTSTTFGTSSQRNIGVYNVVGNWYPAVPAEANTNTGHQVRCIEFFWYTNAVPAANRYLISVRTTGTTIFHRLYTTSSTQLTWSFRNHLNTSISINHANFPFAANLGVWWHSVLMRDADAPNTNWVAYHGRVGLNVDGTSSTQDPWASYLRTATLGGGGGDARMRALRVDTDVTNPVTLNAISLTLGGHCSTYGGTTTVDTNRWIGGIAEFRMWNSLRPTSGKDSLIDLRDKFIDAELYPDLIHCFRLNEAAPATPGSFDDVGYKGAVFTHPTGDGGTVYNEGFDSSPMPDTVFGTATRVGGYKLFVHDTEQRLGAYKIAVPQTATTRVGGYKILLTPAAATRVGGYKVAAPFTEDRDGGYKITSQPAAQERTGSYVITPPAPPADTLERVGTYRLLTSAETETREGGYKIATSDTETRVGGYKIISAIGTESRVGGYKLFTAPTRDVVGGYKLVVSNQIDRPGSYTIAGQPTEFTLQRMGKYKIYNVTGIAEEALRRLKTLRQRTQ